MIVLQSILTAIFQNSSSEVSPKVFPTKSFRSSRSFPQRYVEAIFMEAVQLWKKAPKVIEATRNEGWYLRIFWSLKVVGKFT